MTSERALPAPRVPAIVPLLNPLIRRFLGAGLPFGPNVLLTVRGRSSGLPRTFPVAILEVGDRRYVQSPFGEVNWVRNLRASGEATITRGRRHEEVSARELPPEVAGSTLYGALEPYRRSRLGSVALRLLFGLAASAPIETYLAEARRHPMFELRPRESRA